MKTEGLWTGILIITVGAAAPVMEGNSIYLRHEQGGSYIPVSKVAEDLKALQGHFDGPTYSRPYDLEVLEFETIATVSATPQDIHIL